MRALTAALLTAAVAFGGCGGSSDSSEDPVQDGGSANGGVSAVGGQAMVNAQLTFARCMRKQGIDFPDPGAKGFQFDPSSQGISDERLKQAEQNCKTEARAIAEAAPKPDVQKLEEDRDAMLRFARCMREQDQDVPDPSLSQGGTSVSVPPDAKTNPEFQRASKKCEGLMRTGGPEER